MAGIGLIQVKTNAQLIQEEAAEAKALVDASKPLAPMVTNLAAHLQNKWQTAKREKDRFERIILQNMRACNGEYDSDKLAEIKAIGAPEIFMMITSAKVRSAEAWVKDIVLQPSNGPFGVEPTPVPTLPDELVGPLKAQFLSGAINEIVNGALASGQPLDSNAMMSQVQAAMPELERMIKKAIQDKAKEKAEEMRQQINDQFIEGGWYEAFTDAIPDVILKTGIIKGPIPRMEKAKKFKVNAQGKLTLSFEDSIIQGYERRSPLDIYPGPGGTSFQNTYIFDKLSYTPSQIQGFIGIPGFIEKEIRLVLQECHDGKIFKEWTQIDQDRALAEGKNPDQIYDWEQLHVLEYWGEEQGKTLLEWDTDGSSGMKDKIKDPDIYYPINAYMIGNHVIKAVLNNNENGEKPYSKCSFVEKADSFWGDGLPELIADVQRACNASARALLYNVGMASGPQVEINEERLSDGERAELTPWKRWFVTNDTMLHGGKAIEFYQPTFVAEKLIQVFNFYLKLADEHSGVPAYAHGDPQVGGGGNTASGLSMLMTMAARGIKLLVKNIDRHLIEETVQRQFEWNVRQERFSGLVGDVKIVAKGTASLIAKEQQATRMTELMSLTANPIDSQIMGVEGRKNLLREVIKTHEIDPDKILPDTGMFGGMMWKGAAPLASPANLNAAGEPAQGTDFQTVNARGGRATKPRVENHIGP